MSGSIYVMVKNPVGDVMSVERGSFATYEEAKHYRDSLMEEYSPYGKHEVKLFIELFPQPQEADDLEEEFDSDEMEEEE